MEGGQETDESRPHYPRPREVQARGGGVGENSCRERCRAGIRHRPDGFLSSSQVISCWQAHARTGHRTYQKELLALHSSLRNLFNFLNLFDFLNLSLCPSDFTTLSPSVRPRRMSSLC